jgi:hypothetical protein
MRHAGIGRSWPGLSSVLFVTPRRDLAVPSKFELQIKAEAANAAGNRSSICETGFDPFSGAVRTLRTMTAICTWLRHCWMRFTAAVGEAVAACPCADLELGRPLESPAPRGIGKASNSIGTEPSSRRRERRCLSVSVARIEARRR